MKVLILSSFLVVENDIGAISLSLQDQEGYWRLTNDYARRRYVAVQVNQGKEAVESTPRV